MSNYCKYNVGDIFTASYIKLSDYEVDFRVLNLNVEDDSKGSIRLEYIEKRELHNSPVKFKPGTTIVVKDLWFNTESTGRLLKTIKKEEI